MKLVIGNKNYSSWSLRPWLLMKVLDLPFEEELIPLYQADSKPKLLERAPHGKVPALHDEGLVIWDSLAIVEYLAEQFPGVPVWPRETEARAIARSVACEMHSGFSALRTHMPMNLRAALPGKGRRPEVIEDIERVQDLWQDCRERYGEGGPFLFGEFCAADAFFAPVVTRFVTYEVPLADACADYRDAILGLPAMQEWYSAGVQEAERIAASEPYAPT